MKGDNDKRDANPGIALLIGFALGAWLVGLMVHDSAVEQRRSRIESLRQAHFELHERVERLTERLENFSDNDWRRSLREAREIADEMTAKDKALADYLRDR